MVYSDNKSWRSAVIAFALGAGSIVWIYEGGSSANAEPRRSTTAEPDQHFKSGGRLAEGVLQEILVVVKRMDERLERMERVTRFIPGRSSVPAQEANPAGPGPAAELIAPEIKVKRAS